MNLMSTRDGYGKALVELGKERKDIVVLDADLSASTRTAKFSKVFPDRFFNVGIAEQNLMDIAAGLAASGKIAFASSFAMFATGRCWDQIRNTIGTANLDVKIVASHGGITVGADGVSHQALEDIAIMRAIPDMRVIVPCDALETEKIIKVAVETKGPFFIRISREKTPVVIEENFSFALGKGLTLREGKDVTIIACGIMVEKSLKAYDYLKQQNIEAEVINMSSIKPIDKDLIIKSAKKTNCIVTVEEHSIVGGLGSAVAQVLSEDYPVIMRRIGSRDRFGQSGEPADLLKFYNMEVEDIVQAGIEVINKVK